LIEHPDVGAVSFVGSTPVARQIYTRAARAGKRVQALGGAKNHMVVMPDADLDAAADAAVAAGYGAAGERCMAVSVIVAVGGVADRLIPAITARANELRVGPGSEEGVQMGPLISREHRDRVASYLDGAPSDGAEVVLDGRQAPCASQPGFFLGPSLIDGVRPGTSAYDDEIFGPVLGVVRTDTFEEAVALVRDNPFGNGTALFTRDGGTARRFQRECNIGMVGVNVPIPVPVASSSFGGWKSSLFGDSHMYGPEGIRFFTRQQVVTTRWPDG
jgi:malonate-semialdehyde dehydrogenase (acetylating)/methylmalonate-semialdehyde dehydrogenase